MPKTGNHIKNIRHIVLMWVVLFSLSPCTVKEALLHSAGIDYAKPLNRSKTTTQTNPCQYSSNENQQISAVKQSKFNKQTEPVDFADNHSFAVRSATIPNNYSKFSSGNSPPKYILYRRLKIDIA